MSVLKTVAKEVIPYKDSYNMTVAYKITNALDQETCNIIAGYYRQIYTNMDYEQSGNPPDNITGGLTKGIHCRYDYLGVSLLNYFTYFIAPIVNRKILPSYSFARAYYNNAHLIPHRDRDACEFSASLNLGNTNGTQALPFYIAKTGDNYIPSDNDEKQVINSNVGDLIIFYGSRSADGWTHWRPPFKGDEMYNIFLHYVDQDGPYKSNAYEWLQ